MSHVQPSPLSCLARFGTEHRTWRGMRFTRLQRRCGLSESLSFKASPSGNHGKRDVPGHQSHIDKIRRLRRAAPENGTSRHSVSPGINHQLLHLSVTQGRVMDVV